MINKKLFAVSLIVWGIFSLLIYFNILIIENQLITSLILISYGLLSTNLAFKESNRLQLIISSTVFFIGIIFLIKSTYQIIDSRGLVFYSILFISGANLILLFIENMNKKVFLYSGVIIFISSIVLLFTIEKIGILYFINQTYKIFEIFLPFLLILIGVFFFFRKVK
ncbi:MAG: hypothetical protein N2321_02150 [Melioribacteraceae bacterium]|nr:hypothetical protein [Melioribacteraceae bacterium]